MLSKNLGEIVWNGEGASGAAILDLLKPEQTFESKLFAKDAVRGARHELLNRPAIGLSIVVSSLHATMIIVEEGAAAGIFNGKFARELSALCKEHNIEETSKMLNCQVSVNIGLLCFADPGRISR